jgi:hypothetical protein
MVRQSLDEGFGVAVAELAVSVLQDLFIFGCAHDPVSLTGSATTSVPFETLSQAGTPYTSRGLTELARLGCAKGADAIVVPVPPEALHLSLWGTLIRRRAASPTEQAGVPIHPEGRSANRTVAVGLAEQ